MAIEEILSSSLLHSGEDFLLCSGGETILAWCYTIQVFWIMTIVVKMYVILNWRNKGFTTYDFFR